MQKVKNINSIFSKRIKTFSQLTETTDDKLHVIRIRASYFRPLLYLSLKINNLFIIYCDDKTFTLFLTFILNFNSPLLK